MRAEFLAKYSKPENIIQFRHGADGVTAACQIMFWCCRFAVLLLVSDGIVVRHDGHNAVLGSIRDGLRLSIVFLPYYRLRLRLSGTDHSAICCG